MPKRKQLIELLAALRLLQKGCVHDKRGGICPYLSHEARICKSVFRPVIREALVEWEHFSGNFYYPICHDNYDSLQAYYFQDNLWDKRTKYGRRRYELVGRMIDVCIKHIDSPSSKLSVMNK